MKLPDKLYINGKWIGSTDGKAFSVTNPANMQVIGHLPVTSAQETLQAIEAAENALPQWSAALGKERSKIIRKLFELLIRDKEEFSKIIVAENGKALSEARNEVEYSSLFIEWFAEEAKRIYGDLVPSIKKGQRLFTIKQPVGVVAAITPWNFPLAMIVRKLAPALAAGCTMVIKPSEETPYSALKLAALCEEAGVPSGVVNVVCGDARIIGEAMTSSPKVRMLTFTGSTRVGKTLMAQCAGTVKKVTMELGGNAPFIVFDDANLQKAIDGLIASKVRNGGQSCICANRIFVHSKIIGAFSKELISAYKKLKIGDGLNENNNIGPMINPASARKIYDLIEDAKANKAEILYSADVTEQKKLSECYVAPAILLNHKVNSKIEQTEIFGPIISMFTFDTEEEVIARANASNYGLASYFYTQDKDRIWRVSEALEYGMVATNDVAISSEVACFGGVKESGLGREGGKTGILEYLEDKYIVMS